MRWAHSAGNSATENWCMIIIIYYYMSDQQETEYKIHTEHLVSFGWWVVCFVENSSLTVMKTWPWVLSFWVCSMHLWCVTEILRFTDKRVTQHRCTLGSSISWQKSTSAAWIIWAWKCHCTLFALLDQTASLLGVPFNCQKRAQYNIFIYITLFLEKKIILKGACLLLRGFYYV